MPTTLDQLRDLEARLAAATGPDRELDALIECVLPEKWCVGPTMTERPGFVVSSYRIGGRRSRWKAPETTASIDAAVALCERVLPGWCWLVCDDGASVWNDAPDIFEATHAVPALALCRAIVRAMIAQEEANV